MRAGIVALVLVALAFPVGLALAVYLTAAPSLAAEPVPAAITQRAIAEPSSTSTERRESRKQTTTDRSGSDRCLEPEHRLDPECLSGSGSGSDDGDSSGSGSDNSGPGSDNSGSGSGSSGSGSSGSGGGDD